MLTNSAEHQAEGCVGLADTCISRRHALLGWLSAPRPSHQAWSPAAHLERLHAGLAAQRQLSIAGSGSSLSRLLASRLRGLLGSHQQALLLLDILLRSRDGREHELSGRFRVLV